MLSTVLLVLITSFALYALKIYRQFNSRWAEAKASGLPCVFVPFFINSPLYRLSSLFLRPIWHKLPEKWTYPWLDLIEDWGYTMRYEMFKRMGSDTFLAVSPERVVMYTADAEVITQITYRRNDFPKALEVYAILKIFGDNVVVEEVGTPAHG